jgi:hypothetical protein
MEWIGRCPTLYGSLHRGVPVEMISQLVCKAQAWQVPGVCSMQADGASEAQLNCLKDLQAGVLSMVCCQTSQRSPHVRAQRILSLATTTTQ